MTDKIKSVEELKAFFVKNAANKGYFFNKDEAFVNDLMKGLYENLHRYGYASCPCRLSAGVYGKDEDIICPCEYMESDVAKYGSCYCALYVSKEVLDTNKALASIPESRPGSRIFAIIDAKQVTEGIKWKCQVCGYIYTGDNPPEKCPKCGAGKEFFAKI